MGLHLIGSINILEWLDTAYTILKVAIGLGLVIFVHELGHFLVAKACGVKCEKFYLGFDINGWKLCKFQWGETEYGIGVLPLGGYVKMLGQDDNPARAAEERERAKQQPSHAAAVNHPGDLPAEPTSDEHAAYDPRSYMAKSVPQRMAIISAGVIMNLIFAVIFAAIAYRFGVRYTPAVIGGTSPGYPAWAAGIQPGDKIVRIGDRLENEHLRFEHDVMMNVILTGPNDSLELGVRRNGTDHVDTIDVRPTALDKADKEMVKIGVAKSGSIKLAKDPTLADTAAAKAEPPFAAGDKIAYILSGPGEMPRPIPDYVRMQEALAMFAERRLTITVERPDSDNPTADPKKIDIKVDPNPVHVLGFVLTMGPITAIQKGSPAENIFQVGDRVVSIGGKRDLDPLRIGDELRRLIGKETTIEVERKGATVALNVTPRPPRNLLSGSKNGPAAADELGVAYSVLNTVRSVEADSPADGKLKPGDEITSVSIPAANDEEKAKLKEQGFSVPIEIEFDADHQNGPFLHALLQDLLPLGHEVEFSWTRGGEKQHATLKSVAAKNWFNPERGLQVEGLSEIRQVDSWGEAFSLGVRETKESVWQVLATLRKLVRRELSLSGFGGPITIARVAGASASEGITQLLMFLTFLSANLAVINFLPIPILDGGHMMFLLYEGIRGKPASERTMTILTYLGLILILTLMVFVLGLDITRLFK